MEKSHKSKWKYGIYCKNGSNYDFRYNTGRRPHRRKTQVVCKQTFVPVGHKESGDSFVAQNLPSAVLHLSGLNTIALK